MGRRILMDAGYEVITVNNGSAALKKIHESRPDLIVLDVYMPGYGGLEVCQRLKESLDTVRIPVLLTVGKMEPFKAEEAKRVHADAHIVKPFEASELLAALTKLEDRIVPQEPARSKRGKNPESKKAKSWHVSEDPAKAPSEWTEKIAYLAEMKERGHKEPEAEAAPEAAIEGSADLNASAKSEAPEETLAAAPQPELPVVSDAVSQPAEEFSVQQPTSDESQSHDEVVYAAVETGPTEEMPVAAVSESEPPETEAQAAPVHADSVEESSAHESAQASFAETSSEPPAEEESAFAREEFAGTTEAISGKTQRWVAEPVALTAEEASVALDEEMRVSEQQPAAAVASQTIAAAAPGCAAPAAEVTDQEEEKPATFAAAAAAAQSSQLVSNISAEAEPAASSDAAAAWQNWQHIREAVMSGPDAGAIAEAVADVAKSTSSQPESSPKPVAASDAATESSSSSELPDEALASIVDSVLAELKPKLMKEIAKKLHK
jgi:CheY-like chemotaxis protein